MSKSGVRKGIGYVYVREVAAPMLPPRTMGNRTDAGAFVKMELGSVREGMNVVIIQDLSK